MGGDKTLLNPVGSLDVKEMKKYSLHLFMNKKNLKIKISRGNIEGVLKTLLTRIQSLPDVDDICKKVLALSSRFHQLKREQLAGILEDEQYRLQLNRITTALVELIDEIPESDESVSGDNRIPRVKVRYIVLGLIVLSIIAGWITFHSFFPAQKSDSMQLTVYVHGPTVKTDRVLEHSGKVIVDFGNDRRDPVIGENGRTNLGEIPEKFRNKEIVIGLEAKGFQPAHPEIMYKLDGSPIYFAVRPDNSLAKISGIVKDAENLSFLEGVTVMVDGEMTKTDAFGNLNLVMPEEKQKEQYHVHFKKDGYQDASERYYPQSGPIEIRLKRKIK